MDMAGHLLNAQALVLQEVNRLFLLQMILRKLQNHLAEQLAVDLTRVGEADVHRYVTLHRQIGNRRLVGGAALEHDADHPLAHRAAVRTRRAENQLLGRRGFWLAEYRFNRAAFGEMAVVDDGDVGTRAFHHAHFVGDDDDGDAHFAVDLPQKIENRGRRRRVERTGCFVAENDFRIGRQRAGDGHALLLTAGKLAGVVVLPVRQADDFQQLVNALLNLRALHAGDLHRKGDVAAHVALGKQVEMLEDHRDLLAKLPQLLRRQRREILAIDDDAARSRPLQKVDAAHERRFARARHADDAEDIALLNLQVDVLQGVHRLGFALEGFGQMVQLNERQNGSTPFNTRMWGSPRPCDEMYYIRIASYRQTRILYDWP